MDVGPGESGTITVNQSVPSSYPATFTFTMDTSVHLEAVPASGYNFNHWSGALTDTSNPTDIVIDCNKKITANFSEIEHNWWLVGGIIAGAIIIGAIIWLAVRRRTA